MRWLIQAYAKDLADNLDRANPAFFRIVELARSSRLRFSMSRIDEVIAEWVAQLDRLLDNGLFEDSAQRYGEILDIIAQEPPPWDKVLDTTLFRDVNFKHWRTRFERTLPAGTLGDIEKGRGTGNPE